MCRGLGLLKMSTAGCKHSRFFCCILDFKNPSVGFHILPVPRWVYLSFTTEKSACYDLFCCYWATADCVLFFGGWKRACKHPQQRWPSSKPNSCRHPAWLDTTLIRLIHHGRFFLSPRVGLSVAEPLLNLSLPCFPNYFQPPCF